MLFPSSFGHFKFISIPAVLPIIRKTIFAFAKNATKFYLKGTILTLNYCFSFDLVLIMNIDYNKLQPNMNLYYWNFRTKLYFHLKVKQRNKIAVKLTIHHLIAFILFSYYVN